MSDERSDGAFGTDTGQFNCRDPGLNDRGQSPTDGEIRDPSSSRMDPRRGTAPTLLALTGHAPAGDSERVD